MVARFDNADEAIAAGVDPAIAREQYEHENVWPQDDPNYRDLVLDLPRRDRRRWPSACCGLFARRSASPEDSFRSVGPDTTSVTFNKYPTWTWPDDATDEDKLLLLEHADGNAITILYQDGRLRRSAGAAARRGGGGASLAIAVTGLLAINASHSSASSTHHLAALAVEVAGAGRVVDLAALDPAGLLGLGRHPDVDELLAAIPAASTLVLVSPIYRATYSGLLKVVFDQLPQAALTDVPCVLAATAAGAAHFLAIDTGFRSLIASLDGWSVPTTVYVTPSELDAEKRPSEPVRARMERALGEAARLR